MQKVMSKYILTITGLAIFVLAAVIGIYVLWPAKSPDVEQIPQQDASTSNIQLKTENPQPKRQLTPEDFQFYGDNRCRFRCFNVRNKYINEYMFLTFSNN